MADPLSRDAILGADDRPSRRVSVPEWGGHVYVQALTAIERERLGQASESCEWGVAPLVAAHCLVDAEGLRIFSDEDAADLSQKSGVVLDRILRVFNSLNGLEEDGIAAAVGKSAPTPTPDSGTD